MLIGSGKASSNEVALFLADVQDFLDEVTAQGRDCPRRTHHQTVEGALGLVKI